jgi:hypothetical protein
MHSITIFAGFFFMLLLPCAFAVFSSRDKEETLSLTARKNAGTRTITGSWRAAHPAAEYDIVPQGDQVDPPLARPKPSPSAAPAPAPAALAQASTRHAATSSQRVASTLLGAAALAEAESIAAQVYAAQANKTAKEAIARSAAARAATATALAREAERAVAEATRVADAVRRAYETAPASIGPERHALPESHPSMDFPRSHVIRRAA